MNMWTLLAACANPPVDVPATTPSGEAVLTEAYPPPARSKRVPADAFGTWLRERTVAPVSEPIRTYAGRVVHHDGRVVRLPMVSGDLQQCADSAIRLRAEWLRTEGKTVSFHATSGDPMPWSRWEAGERPYEQRGRLKWRPGTSGGWDAYLSKVFMWAGTRSLYANDTVAASGDPEVGDLLVDPGSPGHAIVLLDVARSDEATYVLVGEGFMPAQDFHVEHGPHGGWWRWDEGVTLSHWPMNARHHRRFHDATSP